MMTMRSTTQIIMDDGSDDINHQASSSSSSTFLQQLVAQRTAFVQVKQEQGQQITMDHASDGSIITNNDDNHDPEGRAPLRGVHGQRAQLPVRAVQSPGGVRGVRRGHQGGVSAVPVLQRADRPGGERGWAGGGVRGERRKFGFPVVFLSVLLVLPTHKSRYSTKQQNRNR